MQKALFLIIFISIVWLLSIEFRFNSSSTNHVELAVPMSIMQKYMDKLYFSGQAKNWKLSSFYLHEIKEQAEAIEKAQLKEGTLELSPLVKKFIRQPIETFESSLSEKTFNQNYQQLVANCNTCHAMSRHDYIQIKIPSTSMFENQEF